VISPSTCSPDTLIIWDSLPVFIQDQDTANGYTFLSWLEGSGSILQTIDTLCRDDSLGNPGWSIICDVTRCPTQYLPWLAQCVGVRFGPNQVTDAAQRAAIETPYGFARGTLAAMQAAAAPYLSTGFTVSLIERTPDPYSYTVKVPAAGVTGGTWGELAAHFATWSVVVADFATWATVDAQTAAITTALQAANPVGLVQTISFV
jgi:hypothetical protein